MPICAACKTLYVRPQTFDTLFKTPKLCVMCETYQNIDFSLSVFPLQKNHIECYSFFTHDHPSLTTKFFQATSEKGILKECLWYEEVWINRPIAMQLLTYLFTPLKLYHPTTIPDTFLYQFDD